ncbi:response regulator transcription factor [Mycolicibacterium hippocampi]|uniref:response regulator transcription factor n=1 Tax=Mycolicibacterium hippocampi TaxID=659824 RepID=UPI0027E28D58|nr:response regulator transcription factor [Mycolicibacterium hippocampi]
MRWGPAGSDRGVTHVLLVDDHPIVHEGVETLIGRDPHLRMCRRAHSAREGAAIAAREPCDVVLLDLHLPDGSAPEAAAAIRSARPGVKVILFTGDARRSAALNLGLIGTDGFVHKDTACTSLVTAIRDVAAGRRFFDSTLDLEPDAPLSRREYQVLQRIAMGESNAEIAAKLGLASNTVKSYVQMLLARMDARNRLEAVVNAQRAGLL